MSSRILAGIFLLDPISHGAAVLSPFGHLFRYSGMPLSPKYRMVFTDKVINSPYNIRLLLL
jgi:hypothetical protein